MFNVQIILFPIFFFYSHNLNAFVTFLKSLTRKTCFVFSLFFIIVLLYPSSGTPEVILQRLV